jgi:NAD(P)-dependent dehydrogenase (short-subunit alcohol dehydrogenase family)
MKILLTGSTGGIGRAIKERLKDHEIMCVAHADTDTDEEFDWLICAHGIINEQDLIGTFMANVISNILLADKINTKGIIFVSSMAGIRGNDKYPVYSASKAALNMYCKLISTKRNCYVLCPGPTDTPMFRKLNITDVQPQSPLEVAKVVERIMNGEFKNGDIISVRNGVVT